MSLDNTRDDREFDESIYPVSEQKPFQYDRAYEEICAPMAVHQCNVCNKIFMTYKGLQQHSVIHTDTKPFLCDVCGRGFRFKSNMFEHRTVHTGYTPHLCPFCGKQFRLKGNMKKHMRVHVTNREELEAAYRPYASNRRSSTVIPENALVIRGSPLPFFGQDKQKRSFSKLLLGNAAKWITMICNNELVPNTPFESKMYRVEERLEGDHTYHSLIDAAKGIEFEIFHCPICKFECAGRDDCEQHLWSEHCKKIGDMPSSERHFCQKCMRQFTTVEMFLQHQSYHSRVQLMVRNHELLINTSDVKMANQGPSTSTMALDKIFANDPGAISLSLADTPHRLITPDDESRAIPISPIIPMKTSTD